MRGGQVFEFQRHGVVVRLEYRDISLLLTGDATSGADVKSAVLKVGHHGSRTSTTQRFVDAVVPTVAIVTTGIKNQFGHPHDEVMERLVDELEKRSGFRNTGSRERDGGY